MKITKEILKQLIKEEIHGTMGTEEELPPLRSDQTESFEELMDMAIARAITDNIIDADSPTCAETFDEETNRSVPGNCQAALENLASNYSGAPDPFAGFGKYASGLMKKAGAKAGGWAKEGGEWAREKLGEEVLTQIIQEEIEQLVKEARARGVA